MTPSGQYRDGLETHLEETRRHAQRIERRLGELGEGNNPFQVGLGLLQTAIGQALALSKTPVDLIRGSGGEEKVLKNAKDSCAAEAQEIATYTALARLARQSATRRPSGSPTPSSDDEQRMLDRLLREIPRLTDAVARAEFDGQGSYDVTRDRRGRCSPRGRKDGQAHHPQRCRPGQAHGSPGPQGAGVARAEGTAKGAVASESDLAIANYDSLSADEVQAKLTELSQVDLAKVNAYERKNQNRSTITSRIDSLQANEPGPATTSSAWTRSVPRSPKATRRASGPLAATSASTRTAPASCKSPSASWPTASRCSYSPSGRAGSELSLHARLPGDVPLPLAGIDHSPQRADPPVLTHTAVPSSLRGLTLPETEWYHSRRRAAPECS